MKKIPCLLLLMVLAGATPVMAASYQDPVPYEFSLFSPLQSSPPSASVQGLRLSLISAINEDVTGLDVGMFNLVDGKQKGLQFGIYNRSFSSDGVQIGIINRTSYLQGLQIGFLNIHEEGDRKWFPLINFQF